jgi:hypothetical protein
MSGSQVVRIDVDTPDYHFSDGAAFVTMRTSVTADERRAWIRAQGLPEHYTPDVLLTNIIVFIPAYGTHMIPDPDPNADEGDEIEVANARLADTVLLSAHFDRPQGSPNAANCNAANVAAMLEAIRVVMDDSAENSNNLVFVFTDGGLEGGLGLLAVRDKFIGFDNVIKGNIADEVRHGGVGFAASFTSDGTRGGVILSQTANITSRVFRQISGAVVTDSVLTAGMLYAPSAGEVNVFGSAPSVSFTNIGGAYEHNTARDNSDNINKRLIATSGALMLNFAINLGSADLSRLADSDPSNFVYFNFLGGTVRYSYTAAYVFGALLLIFAAVVAGIAAWKKALNAKKVAKGGITALIGISLSIAVTFILIILSRLC